MSLLDRWFWSDGEAWSPSLYEWFFQRTPPGRRFRAREQRAVVDMLTSRLCAGQTVLEVGSGTGHYTTLLDDLGARVVARDASEEMVDYLRRRWERERRSGTVVAPGWLPDRLDVERSFDGVLAVGVLNYVEDLGACLDAFARLLTPGGWAVLTVPPDDRSGRRYRLVERAGRRRIHLRSAEEVTAAAERAGLKVDVAPTVVGVMAVYGCVKP